MPGLAGVTVMDDRVGEVTVRIVFPQMLPRVAVIVAVPTAIPVAKPLLLTVTADVLEELQITCVLIS